MKKSAAFSLMEIMIVVAIIGALAAMVGPRLMGSFGKAQVATTKATMSTLKQALQDYNQDIGRFPTEADGGLNALVQRPKGKAGAKWDGPYLEGEEEVPEDAWGFEFEYNRPPKKNKGKYKYYEIVSYGEDGEDGDSEPIVVGA